MTDDVIELCEVVIELYVIIESCAAVIELNVIIESCATVIELCYVAVKLFAAVIAAVTSAVYFPVLLSESSHQKCWRRR